MVFYKHSKSISTFFQIKVLRVIKTQSISFLKSLSEGVGSDLERLLILNDISYRCRLKIDRMLCDFNSESFYVGSDLFRNWFKKLKWLEPGLPLIKVLSACLLYKNSTA